MAFQDSSPGSSTNYCSECGAVMDPSSQFCQNCGAPNTMQRTQGQAVGYGAPNREAPHLRHVPDIPNYLVQSILVTLCCCWPLGIVAIVYAAQVNGKRDSGDYLAAENCSEKAKIWCWVSFGLGIVSNLLLVLAAMSGVFW